MLNRNRIHSNLSNFMTIVLAVMAYFHKILLAFEKFFGRRKEKKGFIDWSGWAASHRDWDFTVLQIDWLIQVDFCENFEIFCNITLCLYDLSSQVIS